MRNSINALTLFDTGAYTSFVNREVAKWLELQQHGGTVAGAHLARSSRYDVPTSEVGLADDELIMKKDIFDPIADDDDIDWKYNPFDVDTIDDIIETPEQLMSQITFEGSTQLQTQLKALVLEFIDVIRY